MNKKQANLKSPYPWFGGKSKIMSMVWTRFGDVNNFVDPFAGSMASLLGRPQPFRGTETVNDANGMVGNFWRCVQRDPLRLALEVDKPVEETWLHANGDAIFYRDDWYAARGLGSRAEFKERLDRDADFRHYEIAGIWVAGLCQWIGDNWGETPANARTDADGKAIAVVRARPFLGGGRGVNRQRPHLGGGLGVNRQLPQLGGAGRAWIAGISFGEGLIDLLEAWPGVTARTWMLIEYFAQLAERFRNVLVCVGNWTRVLGPTPTVKQGLTAVFLDPPYAAEGRDSVYGAHESFTVAHDVRQWCIEQGNDKRLRIALCGYEEHDELAAHGWTCETWKTRGGYANQKSCGNANRCREQVWFSPHCLKAVDKPQLFSFMEQTADDPALCDAAT